MNTLEAVRLATLPPLLAVLCSTLAPAAPDGDPRGHWVLRELVIEPPQIDLLPPGRYEGSRYAYADWSHMEAEAYAYDILDFYETLFVATAACSGFQRWDYVPELDEEGEVEMAFQLSLDGWIHLIDGPSYGIISGFVEFATSVDGIDECLTASFGRATGQGFSLDVSTPMGIVGTRITGSTGEGFYPLPALPDINGSADTCVSSYWMRHRTSVYTEVWADGWVFGPFFDWAEVHTRIEGDVTSQWLRTVCPR